MTLNFLNLDPKVDSDLESLYLLSRESQGKSLLDEYYEQKQALSKYCIGALLLTEPVLAVVRRELKRMSPDVKIEIEEIQSVLSQEVIKRDVIEGEKALEAGRKVTRAANRVLKAKSEKETVVSEASSLTTTAATPSNASKLSEGSAP